MNSKLADGLLLLVAMIWGGGFPAVGLAIEDGMGPAQLTALRFVVAAIGMMIIFFKSLKLTKKEDVIGGCLAGCFLFIGFAFQTLGMQYTTASKNAFITSTYVLLVPLLGLLFFKRRLKGTQWAGILLMVIAISFLSLDKDLSINLGDALTLVCAIGFAGQIVITGLFSKRCNPYCFNTIQMSTVAILSLIWSMTSPWVEVSLSSGAAILYLGLLSTLAAFLIQSMVQRHTSEAKVGLILSSESLFGAILSVLILGDPVTMKLCIGGVLSVLAVMLIEFDESVFKRKDVILPEKKTS